MTKTPNDITSKYAPYVVYARQQAALRQQQATGRHQAAWHTVQQIADFLRQKYQPDEIIVFGSLIHPETFGLHSDIDIAVRGIAWPDYLRAWNEVEAQFPAFEIDLIDISIVSDLMRQRIEAEGQRL